MEGKALGRGNSPNKGLEVSQLSMSLEPQVGQGGRMKMAAAREGRLGQAGHGTRLPRSSATQKQGVTEAC